MDKGLIPKRYAKALYEVGLKCGDNQALYIIMQDLDKAYAAMPALASTMANPFVADADKVQLLKSAAGDKAAQVATFANFVQLLKNNGRLDMARDIALAFVEMYRKLNDIYLVKIASAAPLDDSSKKRMQNVIENHIGKGTFNFEYSVDPSLLGGFTVTVNSERLDASVATQLRALRHQLVQ